MNWKKIKWIGLILLVIAIICAVLVVQYRGASYSSGIALANLFVGIYLCCFISGALLFVISWDRLKNRSVISKNAGNENKAIQKMQNQLTNTVISIFYIIFGIAISIYFLIWFPFGLYSKYQHDTGKEIDYVCFNEDCNYIPPEDYSINFAGTCLTRTDSGLPVQECGGTIDVTKYPPASFWYWLTHPSSSDSEFGLQLPY